MKDIIEVLRNMPDPLLGKGCSEKEIASAEELLGIRFAKDYRKYLSEIGIAAVDGRELTGIGKARRTHVVEVTLVNRERGSEALTNMYVIEETGFDGIVVWQDTNGSVYETRFDSDPIKIAKSLVEYFS